MGGHPGFEGFKMIYFAYGSNIDVNQMAQRCPGAKVMGKAILPRHQLVFAGLSKSRCGGVASVIRSEDGYVPGIIWQMDGDQVDQLDSYEGHPYFYHRVNKVVIDQSGKRVQAITYVLDREIHMPSAQYATIIETAYEKWDFDLNILWDAIANSRKEKSCD